LNNDLSPQTATIPVNRETHSIKTDYLQGHERLKPFYAYPPNSPDFDQIIADKHFPDHTRKVLVEVLRAHYEDLEIGEAARQNLERLALPNTYTLTAGHQLNLFGGPLYTPYKVLTVAKLAAQLNQKHPDFNFVPIFWIHTEDHDFEEINHFFPSYQEKKTYKSAFQGATGDHQLTDEILSLLPAHFPSKLKAHFQPGKSLGEATLAFSMELYSQYGVLVLDASDRRLKALFTDILLKELFEAESPKQVRKTSSLLHDAGYSLQIHARDINLFYLGQGKRDRIILENDRFYTVSGTMNWKMAEMRQEAENHPERFSPNVCLRPLYQEVILPNLAYSGGWGELSYWMQLKGMFDAYDINFPLLLPRATATLFTAEIAKKWQDFGLELADVKLTLPEVFAKYMPHIWQADAYEALSEELLTAFDKMEAYIETLSATLPRSVVGQKVKTQRFIKNTRKKIHRVIRHDHPKQFNEIEQIKEQIQPEGLVQERILGLASFPQWVPAEFIAMLWKKINPLTFDHQFWVIDRTN